MMLENINWKICLNNGSFVEKQREITFSLNNSQFTIVHLLQSMTFRIDSRTHLFSEVQSKFSYENKKYFWWSQNSADLFKV